MKTPKVNRELKQLMHNYELGMMSYEHYRQRRNQLIEAYAGIERRQVRASRTHGPNNQSRTAVPRLGIILGLGIVILFAWMTYSALLTDGKDEIHGDDLEQSSTE